MTLGGSGRRSLGFKVKSLPEAKCASAAKPCVCLHCTSSGGAIIDGCDCTDIGLSKLSHCSIKYFSSHLCSISCSCGIISPSTFLEPGSDSNVSTWWFHQLVECGVVLSPDGAIQLVTGARSGDHHTVYPVVTKWCTTGATESQVVIIGGETGRALGNSDSNALPPPPPPSTLAFHIGLCVQ